MRCQASVDFFWVTTSGGNGYARSDASSRNQAVVLVISDDADHCVPFTEEHGGGCGGGEMNFGEDLIDPMTS